MGDERVGKGQSIYDDEDVEVSGGGSLIFEDLEVILGRYDNKR